MKDPYVIAIHHERWKAAAAKDMKRKAAEGKREAAAAKDMK